MEQQQTAIALARRDASTRVGPAAAWGSPIIERTHPTVTEPSTTTNAAAGFDPNSFLVLFADFLSARTKRESAAGTERARLARLEKAGINMHALRLVESLRKKEPKDARQILECALLYANVLDLEFAKQGDLFSVLDQAQAPSDFAKGTLSKAEAFEEGHKAGKAGRDALDNRFPQGSPLHAAFWDGWVEGQRALADEMGVEPPKDGSTLQPEKKARGRKKKAEAGVEQRDAAPRGRRRRSADAVH